jgi:hypothetical protein
MRQEEAKTKYAVDSAVLLKCNDDRIHAVGYAMWQVISDKCWKLHRPFLHVYTTAHLVSL